MLQFLRSNTKLFAWFFVIVLTLAFGLSSFTFNKHDQYAGEAFGKKVSFQEFRIFETLTRLLAPDPAILEDAQTAYAFAWQQLILSREAKNQKIEVTDDETRAQVDQFMNRGGNNRLSPAEYENLLKSWRTTPHEFENGIREMIRIQKLFAEKFRPLTDASEAGAATDVKKEELQKNYQSWIVSLYQKANIIDYSKLKQTSVSQENPV